MKQKLPLKQKYQTAEDKNMKTQLKRTRRSKNRKKKGESEIFSSDKEFKF